MPSSPFISFDCKKKQKNAVYGTIFFFLWQRMKTLWQFGMGCLAKLHSKQKKFWATPTEGAM